SFEPAAARIAAGRASAAQVLAIANAFRAMAAALPDDVDACCRHDLAFHELITDATGNPLLIRFAAAIRTRCWPRFGCRAMRARATRTRSRSTGRSPSQSGAGIPT